MIYGFNETRANLLIEKFHPRDSSEILKYQNFERLLFKSQKRNRAFSLIFETFLLRKSLEI